MLFSCRQKLIILILAVFLSPSLQAKDLGLTVLGVIASSENQKGIALVKHRSSGKVTAYKEGSQVNNRIKVNRVFRKIVEFKIRNELFQMSVGDNSARKFDPSPSPSPSAPANNLAGVEGMEKDGNTLIVNRDLKDSLVKENLSKILMQAATVPYTENGRLVGFKLLEIDKGSIYDMAGLKNGDIVTHINELPIVDAGRAIKALSSLKTADTASFGFLRKRKAHELMIKIN